MLAPGERAEILVNLEGMNGQQVFLMNYGQEIPSATYGASQPGMGPGQTIPNYTSNPINGSNRNILQLNVVAQTANAVTTIPGNLVTVTPWNEANAVQTRTFTFMSMTQGQDAINGPFTINNEHFDMGVINFEVPFENLEIWELRNQSPIAHPFHVHNVPFYVLSVNGNQPAAHLRGRKDVILVPGGNTTVRIILKFEDFYNDSLPYMYHCHMLTHEDDGMMGQFLVKAPCELLTSGPQNFSGKTGGTAQFSVQVTDTTGVFYQWQVNSGTGFQDLQDAGQFSNTRTATLNVSNLAPFNDNQLYRCVLSGPCDIISPTALLNVSDTGTSGLYLPELSFFLHPNPTFKTLYLKLDSSKPFSAMSYQILDVTGRKEMHGSLDEATEWMFDVRELPEGLYFFRLTDGKSGMTRKFVKSSTSAF